MKQTIIVAPGQNVTITTTIGKKAPMSTWLDDLKKSNPALAADYAIVGNQSDASLRNMVKALELMPYLNTTEDNRRLAAAKGILKARR